jgi:choline dehydrogenase-like flavoprotein
MTFGSGFGGSVSALRLAEKGYRVVVLECGARFEDDGFAAFLDAVERNPDRFELLLTDYDHVIPRLGKRLEAARDTLRHAIEATARAYSIADPELFAWTLTNLGELAGRLTIEQPDTFSHDRLMAMANSPDRAIAVNS